MVQIKKINIKHALIFLFATLLYAMCQMLFSAILMKEDLGDKFLIQLLSHYVVIFTMCIADYLLLLFLNKYIPYSKNILLRIIADFVGVIVICLIVLGMFNYLIYDVLLISKDGLPSFLVKFAFGMTNNIPILLAFELIHYFQSEQKAIADSEKAKREALMFEHETLRAQINPHFLFNSLNVLSSLIYMNPDNANKFTKALSKTYRYVLSLNKRPMVSVEEDLDALESYIFLMEMRFENSFTC
ncbi:MAG: histidine kinase, partial [Prevotellaceae bacterium]|nr:histidine kinase [Prevotellaceae bacterium]